jgi:hypothetical protein
MPQHAHGKNEQGEKRQNQLMTLQLDIEKRLYRAHLLGLGLLQGPTTYGSQQF